MFAKAVSIFFWMLVLSLLTSFLFKWIPFDAAGVFVFCVLFLVAIISIGAAVPRRPLASAVKDTDIRVSFGGRIYSGEQISVLRLQSGGMLINVDVSDAYKKEEEPKPVLKHPVRTRRK